MCQIVWLNYGRGHNFCLQKSRMPTGRIGIFPTEKNIIALYLNNYELNCYYSLVPNWESVFYKSR